MNTLDSSTTYSLLLALFREAREWLYRFGATRASDRDAPWIHLASLCLRESSRGYGQMFVRALGGDEGNPVKTLETYLLDRGWPDDHQFEAAFVEFPLYQRGYTREILETLERARGHKEPADLQAAQVEHVLPQTLSDAWHEALVLRPSASMPIGCTVQAI